MGRKVKEDRLNIALLVGKSDISLLFVETIDMGLIIVGRSEQNGRIRYFAETISTRIRDTDFSVYYYGLTHHETHKNTVPFAILGKEGDIKKEDIEKINSEYIGKIKSIDTF